MKKITSVLLCLVMLFACINVSAINPISVKLDANKVEFDALPVNIDGRVLVPVRTIFEAMGAEVIWDEPTRTVTSKLDGKTVIMTIDSQIMTINNEEKLIDTAPQIINSRTMVPARAAAESFGADVFWDGANNTVNILTPEFSSRISNIKTQEIAMPLNDDGSICSDYSISHFDEYPVISDINDGTDFAIISKSDEYLAQFNIHTDIYSGIEQPVTEEYAHTLAKSLVKAVWGTLIEYDVVNMNSKDFVYVKYMNPNMINPVDDSPVITEVYTRVDNGVVYTLTYTYYGNVPKNISSDFYYMIDTLSIK